VVNAAHRTLIVNADDFGRSPAINQGIVRSHEHGIVTSASLMVRFPAAAGAAEYARAHPDLGVGLHVDLGEWAVRDGAWRPIYTLPGGSPELVAREVAAQLDEFRRLVGADPTHVDSHQHVHREEPVHSLLVELAGALGVPLRAFDPRVTYNGSFYGQSGDGGPLPEAISTEALVALLRALPPGVTELGCHPGETGDFESMYTGEREREIGTLCNPRVAAVIAAEGIELASFRLLA
jgi:predicted glycoside hydrolase/deacetylase ChbG (UPF0249 family)